MNEEDSLPVPASTRQVSRFNWVGLQPSQVKAIAQAMAMSGMFPDIQRDAAKAFVKIMAGQEMGIAPFQAMSDISIIQGKAAAGGNIYAAKVKSSGRYDYRVEKWDRTGCDIKFFEVINGKREGLGTSSFDEKDAEAAGLLNKDSWKRYPRNMYFNRAMTAGVRTFCPDALGGVNAYTPEELGAQVDEDGRAFPVLEPDEAPPRLQEPEHESTTDTATLDDIPSAEQEPDDSPSATPEPSPESNAPKANKVQLARIKRFLKHRNVAEKNMAAVLTFEYDVADLDSLTSDEADALLERMKNETNDGQANDGQEAA